MKKKRMIGIALTSSMFTEQLSVNIPPKAVQIEQPEEGVNLSLFTELIKITDPYQIIREADMYGGATKKQRNATYEPVRTEPKIQRNELCPCGSGKKYKKCCIKD